MYVWVFLRPEKANLSSKSPELRVKERQGPHLATMWCLWCNGTNDMREVRTGELRQIYSVCLNTLTWSFDSWMYNSKHDIFHISPNSLLSCHWCNPITWSLVYLMSLSGQEWLKLAYSDPWLKTNVVRGVKSSLLPPPYYLKLNYTCCPIVRGFARVSVTYISSSEGVHYATTNHGIGLHLWDMSSERTPDTLPCPFPFQSIFGP